VSLKNYQGHAGPLIVFFCAFAVPLFAAETAQANPSCGTDDFVFDSGRADYNQAYEKARRVISSDIRNERFLAGQGWAEVWTRDSSYSIDLALNLLHPTLSRSTLFAIKEDVPGIGECWAQDSCGHFGGWPSLTDAIVGATGAWSLYQATGDRKLLDMAYSRTLHSLQRAERDAWIPATGLFGGCASFMESNSGYPPRYANNHTILASTSALSTNALYFHGYIVAAKMAAVLGQNPAPLQAKAEALKQAINKNFWQEDKGYYGYFIDENQHLDPQMEGLGEALAIIYGIADSSRAERILHSTPTTPNGFPCLWPQFPEYAAYIGRSEFSYYHDGMIWPFVQAYWGLAAAGYHDEATFGQELNKVLILSQKNDTFMEYYHPQDGKPDGSRNQLWSASGYLGMVYHGLFGIDLEDDGIHFAPIVPTGFNQLTLRQVKYRHQVLSITIHGHGSKIKAFAINGKSGADPFLPGDRLGKQIIDIVLTGDEN
jgi:Amylo-alpha-1,6-glucosidase